MANPIKNVLSHVSNLFKSREPTNYAGRDYGSSSSFRPDKLSGYSTSQRSIVNSIYNRISMDVASLDFRHIRLDDDGNYFETIDSKLQEIFSVEANIDQTGRAFIQDSVHSMCDEGCVALVPIETDVGIDTGGTFDILSIRVGSIIEWYPKDVRVNLYNDETGLREDVIVPKRSVAIIENPLYAVMNEPNSTLRRLKTKLDQLDVIDEQSGSGKLDIIIQLPFTIKTAARQEQADLRKKQIEDQMRNSKYGVAYIDAAEKITQLNRATDNNLMKQVEYLTSMLYNQLGLTNGIFDGSASEGEILNYYNRTVEPFANALADELKRKFLTKTARTQKQSVDYYRDVFKLIPISELAEVADKFTRNAILSSNEFRGVIGFKPHPDPEANKLRNKNLNAKDQEPQEIKMEDNKLTTKKGDA